MPRAIYRRSAIALETGTAKLWVLLIGVNQYRDNLPPLQYPALDCQGLAEALAEATQAFPKKEIQIHHDFAAAVPTRKAVHHSLKQIATEAQAQDTILVYFSGHGVLDTSTQQAVLCLADTQKDQWLTTGLPVAELLGLLGQCAARQQVVWLDACHSGGMTLRGAKSQQDVSSLNPTAQLMEVLRRRAAQSQGFYALLSCDQTQRSWEFPELGHGVFTYFLMRGLRGEAADAQGTIEADSLYKYVYHQTLQYIDKTNQQLRLINQQKRSRGETQLQSEYPLQTPKRIVEGIGELILGIRSPAPSLQHPRQAIVVEGLPSQQTTLNLSKILRSAGGFDLEYYPQPGKDWSAVREAIQSCLRSCHEASPLPASFGKGTEGETTTALVYLRGRIEETIEGSWLVLGDGVRLGRSWLRQELRRSRMAQQIVVLDCPGALSLSDWIEDLQLGSDQGQCLIAAASANEHSEKFAQILLETLKTADAQNGLPVASWIAQLQLALAGEMPLQVWLSGAQGVIEVLPGHLNSRGAEAIGFDLGLCPYMGLRAFAEADAQYFHGRTELTRRLIQELSRQSCLAVVGASGSGKSSVVQAGLIAQLRQGQQLPGSDRWWIQSMRPGNCPLEALSRRLVDAGTDKERTYQQLQIEGLLHQGVESFVHWLRSRPEPMVVLVVDQFEELFTLAAGEDRQRFLDLVLGGIEYASDRFKLVFTLRADFIAPCLEISALAPVLQSGVLVPPCLSDDDYRRVIMQPAEQVGLTVEPGLIEVLLQELSHTAGDLPLLEFVLEQLWQQRRSGELTLQAYQQQIGGLRGALERKAQAVYDGLDAEAQACARWIFLSLTQLGDGTEDTRRRVAKSDLVVPKYPLALVDRTLQALIAAKLVVVGLEDDSEGHSKGNDQEPTATEQASVDSIDSTTTTDQHSLMNDQHSAVNPKHSSVNDQHSATYPKHSSTNDQHSSVNDQHSATYPKHSTTNDQHASTNLKHSATNDQRSSVNDQHSNFEVQVSNSKLNSSTSESSSFLEVSVEVAHEILIRYWSTLRWWLEENRMRLQAQRQIEQAALQWQQSQQQPDFLLRGIRLAQAEELYVKYVDELPQATQQFIEACFEKRQREQQAAKRRLRKAQITATTIGILGMIACGFAGFAYWQQRNAQLREIEALSASSEALLSSNHQLEALIAGVKAGRQLQRSDRFWNLMPATTRINAIATLQQALDLTQERDRLEGHSQKVNDVSVSRDGFFATASDDKTVKLWQPDGTLIRDLVGHQDRVNAVAFSADGNVLASGSADKTIKLWHRDGKLLQTLSVNQWVNHVQFSPDDKLLAIASRDGTVKLWRLGSTQPLQTLGKHKGWVNRVSFSPDRKLLATVGEDGTVKLWQTSGKSKNRFIKSFTADGDRVTDVTFNASGNTLATTGADKTAKLWTLSGRLLTTLEGHTDQVNSIQFRADNKQLATAASDGTIALWNPQGARLQTIPAHRAEVLRVRFSADGRALVTASADKTARVWRITAGLPTHRVSAAQFSPNGKWIATIAGKTIQLRSRDLQPLATPLKGHTANITAIAFSPNGEMLASASADKTLKLWSVENQTLLKTFTRQANRITALSFRADGKVLASASADKTIQLWNVTDGTLSNTLSGHTDEVSAVRFSPNGRFLASGSYDNTLRLWNLDSAQSVVLGRHDLAIAAIAFSPDGQTLASASWDNTLKLWKLENDLAAVLKQTLTGHSDGVTSLSFSPNGKILVSGSADTTLKLWAVINGTLIKTLIGHSNSVGSVSFSPDNQTLLSSSSSYGAATTPDQTLLWNLNLDQLLNQGCDRLQSYLPHARIHKDSDLCPAKNS